MSSNKVKKAIYGESTEMDDSQHHPSAYDYLYATTGVVDPQQQQAQQQQQEYLRAAAYAYHQQQHQQQETDPNTASMDAATQQYMIDAAAAAVAAATNGGGGSTVVASSSSSTAVSSAEDDVKLFDGFSFAMAYQPQDAENIWKMEDLKKKVTINEGTFHDQLDDKVNIILVLGDHVVDTNRINHAVKFSIPVVSEQYVYDCVNCNTRLDWNQYVVMPMQSALPFMQGTDGSSVEDHMSAAAVAAASMSVAAAAAAAANSSHHHHQQQQQQQQHHHHQQHSNHPSSVSSMRHHHANSASSSSSGSSSSAGIISTTPNHGYGGMMGTGSASTGGSKPPNAKANFQLKMYLKGSRQSMFNDLFPEVLYTLTWKHKYDVQIKATDKIFEGRSQSKIMDSLEVALVLSQTNEIPVYDEEEKKRKRKRSKSDELDQDGSSPYDNGYGGMGIPGLQQQGYGMPAGFTGIPTSAVGRVGTGSANARNSKKRPASSKNSNETVCVSSLHKSGDDEIVIRFGVNSTFCSKRFNYGAFKLYINYAPPDVSEDFHFTIYSAEFKTFVKKNANIAKYLHSPHPLSGVITVVTKTMTQKIKVEYAKYMTADVSVTEASSVGGGAALTQAKKRQRKIKKPNKKGDAEESTEMDAQMQAYSQQYSAQLAMQNSMGFDPNYMGFQYMQMNMMNPMTAAQYSHLASAYMGAALSPESVPETPQSAAAAAASSSNAAASSLVAAEKYQWYGDPVGVNVNGDVFYYTFSMGDEVYKIGEYVFLSPTTEDGRECEPPVENGSEDWDRLWICKIINLVHTKMEGMKMIGQWFYRSSDLPDSSMGVKHANELFVSFDINYNQLNSIRGKCQVRHCTEPDSEENRKYTTDNPQKHFFFRSGFNRLRAEVFELSESILQLLKGKPDGEETFQDIEDALGLHSAIVAHMEQQAMAYSMQVYEAHGMAPEDVAQEE